MISKFEGYIIFIINLLYFVIQVTPLGINLCLLEEWDYAEMETLAAEGSDWLKNNGSKKLGDWRSSDVDTKSHVVMLLWCFFSCVVSGVL